MVRASGSPGLSWSSLDGASLLRSGGQKDKKRDREKSKANCGTYSSRVILEKGGVHVHGLTDDQVREYAEKGVLLNGKQIYILALGKNTFILLPKGLQIECIHDSLNWEMILDPTYFCGGAGIIGIEVAKLQNVSWLDISGKFRTDFLSRDTTYQILLEAKLESENRSLDTLKCKITLPGGEVLENPISFETFAAGSWGTVHLYDLDPDQINKGGKVSFCIYCHSDSWKSGLVVGGVSFKPKSESSSAAEPP